MKDTASRSQGGGGEGFAIKIKALLRDGGEYHTPHIPNPRPRKHADELTGRATIITDRNYITQCAIIALEHLIEHIHQAIGRRSAREDHNLALGQGRGGCH